MERGSRCREAGRPRTGGPARDWWAGSGLVGRLRIGGPAQYWWAGSGLVGRLRIGGPAQDWWAGSGLVGRLRIGGPAGCGGGPVLRFGPVPRPPHRPPPAPLSVSFRPRASTAAPCLSLPLPPSLSRFGPVPRPPHRASLAARRHLFALCSCHTPARHAVYEPSLRPSPHLSLSSAP
jgi:hypothetical protein